MKILQLNASYKPSYSYGGPTLSISRLCEQLVKNGLKVEVFTTTANGSDELPVTKNIAQLVEGVPVRYFSRLTKDHSHFSPGLLIELWKNIRSFDLVHIHTWWNLVSVLSCLIAHLRDVPVILSPRGTLSPYSFANRHRRIKKLFHILLGKSLLNRCYLHTTSQREQQAVTQLLKPAGVFNIYNLVKLGGYIPAQPPENGMLRLLFLSRIQQKKGIELLFKALSALSIPYQLSIAGHGDRAYLKKLQTLSRRYRISAQINWIGYQSQDKFRLMAQHHVLVLPSYDENFGNVIVESLSVGTAVLISNKIGLATFVRKNNLGWICKTSSGSLRDSLIKIYESPGILHSIRASAPEKIIQEFNDEQLAALYLQMYQQVKQLTKPNHV